MSDAGQRSAQRQRLAGARLRALAGAFGITPGDPGVIPQGAVGRDGTTVFGVIDTDHVRSLGAVALWAGRAPTDRIIVCTDLAGSELARRASTLTVPTEVHTHVGAETTPAEPTPVAPAPVLSDEHLAWATRFAAAGAAPVDNHGRLVAEVLGLEVARTEPDPAGGVAIEIGVGRADREIHGMLDVGADVDEVLRQTAERVAGFRVPGGMHPLHRVARARWLRAAILDDPSLVGLDLPGEPLPPLRSVDTVLVDEPAAALFVGPDGSRTLVAATVGFDPDLGPEVADLAARSLADRVIVATPRRDLGLVERALATVTLVVELVETGEPWAAPSAAGDR